jgi:hypothetical protein
MTNLATSQNWKKKQKKPGANTITKEWNNSQRSWSDRKFPITGLLSWHWIKINSSATELKIGLLESCSTTAKKLVIKYKKFLKTPLQFLHYILLLKLSIKWYCHWSLVWLSNCLIPFSIPNLSVKESGENCRLDPWNRVSVQKNCGILFWEPSPSWKLWVETKKENPKPRGETCVRRTSSVEKTSLAPNFFFLVCTIFILTFDFVPNFI